jgi:hypothetical protein
MEGTPVIKGFLAGAVVGGVVVWFWGNELRASLDDWTQGFRQDAAGRLQDAAERLQSAADRVEDGLTGAPKSSAGSRFEQLDSSVGGGPAGGGTR